ncbi:hypothetical protein [Natrialba asiatica]|uniref:Uncharacterized protein n=1 Tax=Natrialba asiatica (strain ATCC 700177 / DSM 12278 / JCM 9576 / FERM P-10747 / NBRC 102637 / 172P1) TaxID=29540 RepID=M0AQD7_NATA1|nr:hypothetical protein [Natrialba asiatica]ELZ00765.1 hypothetical protein C481_11040 [Natrialba asiatica DSM 12278]
MPETIQDIKLQVRDILRDGWDNSDLPVSLVDRDIHTGWFDDGKGFPQVGVTNTNEGPFGGGQSGFSAITGDGSGGIQTRSGSVMVTAFAGSRDDYDSVGLEEYQADQMAQEIECIIGQNQSPDSLEVLSVGQKSELIDTDATPTEHSVQFLIQYAWKKTPPSA